MLVIALHLWFVLGLPTSCCCLAGTFGIPFVAACAMLLEPLKLLSVSGGMPPVP